MAYCTTTDMDKYGGKYMNTTVPVTITMDRDLFIDDIANKIDEILLKAGIVLPVAAGFTKALERLKEMNAYGALAMQESALRTRATPKKGVAEQISEVFQKKYDDMMKTYADYPQKLFAGADDTDAYDPHVWKRPRGDAAWSYNEQEGVEPTDWDDYI